MSMPAVRLLKMQSSDVADLLAFQLKLHHAPLFEREYRLCQERRFRADFYFPTSQLVVEVDGGGWINGRHSRGNGMDSDAEKSAIIAKMPARLMRVTPKFVKNGHAVQWILEALKS